MVKRQQKRGELAVHLTYADAKERGDKQHQNGSARIDDNRRTRNGSTGDKSWQILCTSNKNSLQLFP